MFIRTNRIAAQFATAILIASVVTGCGRSITSPDSRSDIRSSALAHHDDDPANCHSGYMVVDGRVVCN
jgi:hypothetical protein